MVDPVLGSIPGTCVVHKHSVIFPWCPWVIWFTAKVTTTKANSGPDHLSEVVSQCVNRKQVSFICDMSTHTHVSVSEDCSNPVLKTKTLRLHHHHFTFDPVLYVCVWVCVSLIYPSKEEEEATFKKLLMTITPGSDCEAPTPSDPPPSHPSLWRQQSAKTLREGWLMEGSPSPFHWFLSVGGSWSNTFLRLERPSVHQFIRLIGRPWMLTLITAGTEASMGDSSCPEEFCSSDLLGKQKSFVGRRWLEFKKRKCVCVGQRSLALQSSS